MRMVTQTQHCVAHMKETTTTKKRQVMMIKDEWPQFPSPAIGVGGSRDTVSGRIFEYRYKCGLYV